LNEARLGQGTDLEGIGSRKLNQPDLSPLHGNPRGRAQWTKIGVRTNLTGTVEFTDTFAAKYAQRFYRGLAP